MKKILLTLLFILGTVAAAQAQTFEMTTYYPAPSMYGSWIRLMPLGAQAEPCDQGKLYYDSASDNLMFCDSSQTWVQSSSTYWQAGSTQGIQYTDSTDPATTFVGIGVADPLFTLHVEQEGSILATGLADGGAVVPSLFPQPALFWYPPKSAFRVGIASPAWDDPNVGATSVAFGENNIAGGAHSTVAGGHDNAIGPASPTSFIGGGVSNAIAGGGVDASNVISGGMGNQIMSNAASAFIGGGQGNHIMDDSNTIVGGIGNIIQPGNPNSFIGGGTNHEIGLPAGAGLDFIGGGDNHLIIGLGSTIAGGINNEIGDAVNGQADMSTIAGGSLNRILGGQPSNFIGGGVGNEIRELNQSNVITGGNNNIIFPGTNYGTIAGGGDNAPGQGNQLLSGAMFSTIGGGNFNTAAGPYNTIGGGVRNWIDNDPAAAPPILTADQFVTIGGGANNHAWGTGSTIAGGRYGFAHTAPRDYVANPHPVDASDPNLGSGYHTIAGGYDNTATGDFANISGGKYNFSLAKYAGVGGGFNNTVALGADYGTVAGGYNNLVSANSAVISGGHDNISSGTNNVVGGGYTAYALGNDIATVSGGADVWATAMGTTIGGGYGNVAGCWLGAVPANYPCPTGTQAFPAPGEYSTVSGGLENWATGALSVVPGGSNNFATGYASYAFGVGVNAAQNYSYIIGNGVTAYQVGINQPAPNAALHVNGNAIISGTVQVGTIPIAAAPQNTVWETATAPWTLAQDIAEKYTASEIVAAADVLVIDPDNDVQLRKSAVPYQKTVAGIASIAPAIYFEDGTMLLSPQEAFTSGTEVPLALTGRVLCKVSAENGPIERGDLLVTSSTPGHAMKATDHEKAFGAVVGKALQPFSGGENGETTGMIVVLVTLQ